MMLRTGMELEKKKGQKDSKRRGAEREKEKEVKRRNKSSTIQFGDNNLIRRLACIIL